MAKCDDDEGRFMGGDGAFGGTFFAFDFGVVSTSGFLALSSSFALLVSFSLFFPLALAFGFGVALGAALFVLGFFIGGGSSG